VFGRPLEIIEKGIKYVLSELGVYTPSAEEVFQMMLDENKMILKSWKEVTADLGINIEPEVVHQLVVPGMPPLDARWVRSERSIILPTPPPAGDLFRVQLLESIPALRDVLVQEPAVLTLENIQESVRMLMGVPSRHLHGRAVDITIGDEVGMITGAVGRMEGGINLIDISFTMNLDLGMPNMNEPAMVRDPEIEAWEERWHRRA